MAVKRISILGKTFDLDIPDPVNNLTDGGTDVPLSAEMGKELNEKISCGGMTDISSRFVFTDGGIIDTIAGAVSTHVSVQGYSYSDFTDVSDFQGQHLALRAIGFTADLTLGIAFYNARQTFISSVSMKQGVSVIDGVLTTVIPANAVYVRTTWHLHSYSGFGDFSALAGEPAVPIKEKVEQLESMMEDFHPAHSGTDYSDEESAEIPMPTGVPKVNIISPDGLATAKGVDIEATLEYDDGQGNYFSKPIILNAQGNSSMMFYEKNQAIDLDDGSEIKFGNWVSQDSFHLKAYYQDVLRGVNNIAYKYVEEVIRYMDARACRVLYSTTATQGEGIVEMDFSCALCHPDGFPIELYLNGTYYGLFTWNLKKHRKNYLMGKNDYDRTLLDGDIRYSTFFGGSVNWGNGQAGNNGIELRNPKKLILLDGTSEYDGDAPAEIIGTDSPNYDSSNSNHVKTAQTKAMILEVAGVCPAMRNAADNAAKKALFEAHFDIKALKVYWILGEVMDNYDGFGKNWQWSIYNGMAAPNFYDMDSLFGRLYNGVRIFHAPDWGWTYSTNGQNYDPIYWLRTLYLDEVKEMYALLRRERLISVQYIMRYVYDWCDRIGQARYARNIEKWPIIPSYREDNQESPYPDGTDSYANSNYRGMYDSPERIRRWLEARIQWLDTQWEYSE